MVGDESSRNLHRHVCEEITCRLHRRGCAVRDGVDWNSGNRNLEYKLPRSITGNEHDADDGQEEVSGG